MKPIALGLGSTQRGRGARGEGRGGRGRGESGRGGLVDSRIEKSGHHREDLGTPDVQMGGNDSPGPGQHAEGSWGTRGGAWGAWEAWKVVAG